MVPTAAHTSTTVPAMGEVTVANIFMASNVTKLSPSFTFCPGLTAMLAIKPGLEVRDGEVEEAGKVRTRSKALRLLVERVKEGPFENLAVLHGNAPDLDELLDLLEPLTPRDEIVVGQIGPVIGTHAGPRVIGVTFQAGG